MQNELFEYNIDDKGVTIIKYIGQEPEVTIPLEIDGKPVTKIGKRAFFNCTFLKSVTFPGELPDIADDAFDNCPDLTLYQIDHGDSSDKGDAKKEGAFSYRFNTTGVTIVKYNGNEIEVTIPSEIAGKPVTKIGAHSFEGCTSMQAVHIPDTVTFIGKMAFAGCTSMTDVIIPKSVRKIEDYAFSKVITSASLPLFDFDPGNNFKNLDAMVFSRCGEWFLIDSKSTKQPVCPICGLKDFFVPKTSCASTLGVLAYFLISIIGIICLTASGHTSPGFGRTCIVFVFFGIGALFTELKHHLAFQAYKSSTNPSLAQIKRKYPIPEPAEPSPAGFTAEAAASPSAASKNADVPPKEKKDNPLQDFQDYLDKQQAPSSSPSVYHRNESSGCSLASLFLICGFMIFATIACLSSTHGPSEALIFLGLSLPIILILIFLIKEAMTPLEITVNTKGILCNKLDPPKLPWDNVLSISFSTTPVTLFFSIAETSLIINLKLKGNQKRKLELRFPTEIEARQCRNSIEAHYHNAKLLQSKTQSTP